MKPRRWAQAGLHGESILCACVAAMHQDIECRSTMREKKAPEGAF
jgi:hypothetical protein